MMAATMLEWPAWLLKVNVDNYECYETSSKRCLLDRQSQAGDLMK